MSKYTDKLEVLSFKNLDNSIATVILNRSKDTISYNLVINDVVIKDKISGHSIVTYLSK